MPSFFIVFLVFWILLNLQGDGGSEDGGVKRMKWGDKKKVRTPPKVVIQIVLKQNVKTETIS